MIPCKTCLKYAACYNKTQIRCDDFHDELVRLYRQNKKDRKEFMKATKLPIEDQNKCWDVAWDVLKETFPRMNSIYRGVAKYTQGGTNASAV